MQGSGQDLKYWLAFHRIPGVGRVRFARLEQYFGTLEEAWAATSHDLRAAGLDQRTVAAIVAARPDISPDVEIERLHRYHIRALTWHDAGYPVRLKETDDPPPVLYLRGEIAATDEWAVTVVGTRRATAYGRQAAQEFSGGLARNGITVVSGLARGIDAVAHRAALEATGRTIAVLACGLDMVYPPEHLALAKQISQQGALISEYPLGTQPRADYFPRRNRIMSGISLGTLVVEGDVKSGAMITARLALDQNREVFAVPGSIFTPTSYGTNQLIRDGHAKLVVTAQDIMEELNLTHATQQMELAEVVPADATEESLLRHLSAEPQHIDEVRRASGLPTAVVSSTLAMLELKGLVRQTGPMTYVRVREVASGYHT